MRSRACERVFFCVFSGGVRVLGKDLKSRGEWLGIMTGDRIRSIVPMFGGGIGMSRP